MSIEPSYTMDSDATSRARVMILHRDPSYLRMLSLIFSQSPPYEFASCIKSTSYGFDCYRNDQPDLLICGIQFEGMGGLEFTKTLVAEFPKAKILIVSACDESIYALRALRAGARGYVSKESGEEEILKAAKSVLEENNYVSPRFTQRIIASLVNAREFLGESPVAHLSDRELEILTWVAKGYTSRQIAEMLFLSVKTVETHRTHIKTKMGFKSTFELKLFAKAWLKDGMP